MSTIFRKLSHAAKHVLELDFAGPNLTVYPDDTFLVSYPKSGSTWMRFLITNLLCTDKAMTLVDTDRYVPIRDGESRRFFKAMARPRVIKYHGTFDPRYERVIYMVRDPRDVVYSGYVYNIKLMNYDENYPLDKHVSRFIKGETSGLGSWGENVGSWLSTRGHSPDFLLLRYEDLLAETSARMADVASFLRLARTPEQLARVIENSSAKRMRELEKIEGHIWKETRYSRKDIPFVRSAKAGGWRANLPQNLVSEIESAWGDLMRMLGYELTAHRNGRATNLEIEQKLPVGAPALAKEAR